VQYGRELARRMALGDTELHLAVDTGNGLLYLERQGPRLREMLVRLSHGAGGSAGSALASTLSPSLALSLLSARLCFSCSRACLAGASV